ncbi:beta strand repeat-containing protein [Clostridium estertheticum]|uniref:Uncharacterized protein n=1 Tax=Clostridium estertheticum TaxID=238834 RepID=A0A7Y3SXS0_9CLOT|nr:hypothetical protein [Clostridium estertheticum]NNU77336.1 hypothetical protein [Clostridium estertheticum]WBL47071.1 hypothetical protein LOR37_20980 [Clostridium estertheticum]
MNKKITSTALAALMIAGSTSFSAFAAMDSGTVVIGTKAFDLSYANDPANATEISAAILAGGTVYVKDFNGNWLDNVSGASVNASVIPAVTYTNSKGSTQIGAGDASTVAATSETTTAMAANALKVTFNGTVADTSKVTFDVKAVGGTAITTVVSWNTAKTEATLTKASSFTAGDYTVAVTNDTVVLPTQTVTMSQQKIAKIQILSTKLGVTTNAKTSLQKGYATYAIFDQYGVDITNGALANNVNFQTGVGTADAKKGLITITPASGLNLMTFNSGVTITANDTNTGTSATATLAVTSQLGTLTNITLTGLTNKDNKVLTAGDTTDVFYADFTATDISGNPTTNYTLMQKGLIFSGVNDDNSLTTSSPNVTAKLVQDPNDSNKGVIEVRTNAEPLTVDMPLVITAMTWTGSTSQINTTLHKQAEVYTFTLLAPADSIASGESKEIPFIALDQNGGKLTKFSDFPSDLVTFNGLIPTRNNDGTLSLKNIPVSNTNGTASIPEVVSAMTKSGKYSNLTLNIQKPTVADTLALDTSVLNTTMQASSGTSKPATQFADFGWDNGGLKLKDQYDRAIDINATENAATYKNYKVVATSSNPLVITTGAVKAGNGGALADGSATGVAGVGENEIAIQSLAAGSSTVSFSVYDITSKTSDGKAPAADYSNLTAIDTKTQTFTVLADSDIKDYKIDQVATPMYSVHSIDGSVSAAQQVINLKGVEDKYKANPKVYGTTSTGSKVVLRGTPITGATSSSSDFTVVSGNVGTKTAYDGVKIIANKFADAAKTGSSATITVTLLGADNISHTVTTPVTSLKADPVATGIDANVDTYVPGISRLDDVVTITSSTSAGFKTLLGTTLSKYDATGAKGHIYFAPKDQYGTTSYPLSQFSSLSMVDSPNGTKLQAGSSFVIDPTTGALTYNVQSGDFVTVSGTTSNGYTKTIKIVFANGTTTSNPGTPVVVGAAAALEAVNNSVDIATMQTALLNTDLGLNATSIAAYKSLLPLQKSNVATELLTTLQTSSYANIRDLQTALDNEATGVMHAAEASVIANAAATRLVVTAETKTATSVDINAAQSSVTALRDATTKAALQGRIDVVNAANLAAVRLVTTNIGSTFAATGLVGVAVKPLVPTGYTIAVTTSSDLSKYDATGKIVAAGTSNVSYTVTNTATGATSIAAVNVTVAVQTVLQQFTLATDNTTLLGGTVDNSAATITYTNTATPTDSGIFDKLLALGVTGVKLGTDPVIAINSGNTVAAKAAIEAYFAGGAHAFNNTVITVTVTGANGVIITVPYTLVSAS